MIKGKPPKKEDEEAPRSISTPTINRFTSFPHIHVKDVNDSTPLPLFTHTETLEDGQALESLNRPPTVRSVSIQRNNDSTATRDDPGESRYSTLRKIDNGKSMRSLEGGATLKGMPTLSEDWLSEKLFEAAKRLKFPDNLEAVYILENMGTEDSRLLTAGLSITAILYIILGMISEVSEVLHFDGEASNLHLWSLGHIFLSLFPAISLFVITVDRKGWREKFNGRGRSWNLPLPGRDISNLWMQLCFLLMAQSMMNNPLKFYEAVVMQSIFFIMIVIRASLSPCGVFRLTLWIPSAFVFGRDSSITTSNLLDKIVLCIAEMYSYEKSSRMRFVAFKKLQWNLECIAKESQNVYNILSVMLPKSIISRLVASEFQFSTVTDRFDPAYCIFIDFFGKDLQSFDVALAAFLVNETFRSFDRFLRKFKEFEKIKTISSKVMLLARPDQADLHTFNTKMTLMFRELFENFSMLSRAEVKALMAVGHHIDLGDRNWSSVPRQIRIGVDRGPVVAGIVGEERFCYDLYGDTVNTESLWQIVTSADVKGKGVMDIYELKPGPSSVLKVNTISQRRSRTPTDFAALATDNLVQMLLHASACHLNQFLVPEKQAQPSVEEPLPYVRRKLRLFAASKGKDKMGRSGFDMDIDGGAFQRSMYTVAQEEPNLNTDKYAIDSDALCRRSSPNLVRYPSASMEQRHRGLKNQKQMDPLFGKLNEELSSTSTGSKISGSVNRAAAVICQSGAVSPGESALAVPAPLGHGATSSFFLSNTSKQMMSNVAINILNTDGAGDNSRKSSNASRQNGDIWQKGALGKKGGPEGKPNLSMRQSLFQGLLKEKVRKEDVEKLTKATLMGIRDDINKHVAKLNLCFKDPRIESEFRTFRFVESIISNWYYAFCEVIVSVLYLVIIYMLNSKRVDRRSTPSSHAGVSVALIIIEAIFISLYSLIIMIFRDSSKPGWEDKCRKKRAYQILTKMKGFLEFITQDKFRFSISLFIRFSLIFIMLRTLSVKVVGDMNLSEAGAGTAVVLSFIIISSFFESFAVPFAAKSIAILILTSILYYFDYTTHRSLDILTILDYIVTFTIGMLVTYRRTLLSKTEFLLDQVLALNQMKKDEVGLLKALLPNRIIRHLMRNDVSKVIVVEKFSNLTVLHLDVKSFTALSSAVAPDILISILNTVYTEFDMLCRQNAVEKILTIGDAYICSSMETDAAALSGGGAVSCCKVALLMQDAMANFDSTGLFRPLPGGTMKIRVGVNSGTAFGFVTGGLTMLKYELLGDAVDTAEKVQELASPGSVVISNATVRLLERIPLPADLAQKAARSNPQTAALAEQEARPAPRLHPNFSWTPLLGAVLADGSVVFALTSDSSSQCQ
ncbi:hypothetical protein HDU67_010040 [Dinochytrium kinnereticum]|nr:hypothetical protein HDU67_010040 [Dinochytrium kinnereticum]